MPPLGVAGHLGGGNEGLWENLHLLRIYDFPDMTDIVIVPPGEITRSLADMGDPRKHFLWSRLISKYKVPCHGTKTLTKNGGPTLRSAPLRLS